MYSWFLDGRCVATEEGSKFIETSAGINHQVDELLVGIISQIRLKQSSKEKALQKRESVSLGSSSTGAKLRGGRCSGCAGCKAKGILKRILKKACSRSKSCDNLHVLWKYPLIYNNHLCRMYVYLYNSISTKNQWT